MHGWKKPSGTVGRSVHTVATWETSNPCRRASPAPVGAGVAKGRGAVGKTAVVGARERGGKVSGQPVERIDSQTLVGFTEAHALQGGTVHWDDTAAYRALVTIFNQHQHGTVNHSANEHLRREVQTHSIKGVWAALNRSITAMWRHISKKHLAGFVNEASFRLNEGNVEAYISDRRAALANGIEGRWIRHRNLAA